ncbi:MAG: hypothetical protein QXJ45_06145 [Thermoproteota archaeon]
MPYGASTRSTFPAETALGPISPSSGLGPEKKNGTPDGASICLPHASSMMWKPIS